MRLFKHFLTGAGRTADALKTPASQRTARVFGASTGNRTADARAIGAYDDIVAGKNIINTIGSKRLMRAVDEQMNNRSILEKLKDVIPGNRTRLQRQFATNTKHPGVRGVAQEIDNMNKHIDAGNMNITNNLGHFGGLQNKMSLEDIINRVYPK